MEKIQLSKLHVIIILLMPLIFACGSVTCLKHGEADYEQLNQLLSDKEVIVELYDNMKIQTTCLNLNADSTNITGTKISTKEIFQISYKNHSKGFSTGMYIGASAGGILGAVVGGIATTSQTGAYAGMAGLPYFGVGILAGVLCGGIIGGTSGTTELITFISSFPMSKVGSAETVPEIYIEFDAIREKGPDYIIIDWQGKEIRLLRSEYKYRGITSDGKPFILIYKDIYQYKF